MKIKVLPVLHDMFMIYKELVVILTAIGQALPECSRN
jgi:hypothetical protein